MTTAYAGPIVPPGQYPPLAVVTSTDHSAWIIISSALGMSLSVLFVGIRVFIRASSGTEYGIDDWVVIGTTILCVIQASVVLAACNAGLGKSIEILPADALEPIEKMFFASNLLYIVCLVLSKAAVACFMLRLTPIDSHRRFLRFILAALVAWGIAFIFSLALVCDLSHPWTLAGEQCPEYIVRWGALEGIGCLYEVAIVGMSLWLVWSLKTNLANKIAVIAAFASRSIILAIVIIRLESFSKRGLSTDPTLFEAPFIVWTSTELNYSIISATFPIIRPFLNNLATHYGGQGTDGDWTSSGYSRSKGDSAADHVIHMETLASTQRKQDGKQLIRRSVVDVQISGGIGAAYREDAASIGSDDSRKIIIKRM